MLTRTYRGPQSPVPTGGPEAHTSRGFELTSIKAAYVIERLNDVFGPCGAGWRYVHSPLEDVVTDDKRLEVVTEVAFQYQLADNGSGCGRVTWTDSWQYGTGSGWSEPIFACGGKGLGRGGAPYTDARKSAVTDGLTKSASMIGVGHEVFKGLVRTNSRNSGGNGKRGPSKPNTGPSATTFWKLYNEQGKPRGIPVAKAKQLADNGDWSQVCAGLQALIETVQA